MDSVIEPDFFNDDEYNAPYKKSLEESSSYEANSSATGDFSLPDLDEDEPIRPNDYKDFYLPNESSGTVSDVVEHPVFEETETTALLDADAQVDEEALETERRVYSFSAADEAIGKIAAATNLNGIDDYLSNFNSDDAEEEEEVESEGFVLDDENEQDTGGFFIDEILADAIDRKASDVHVLAKTPVCFTVNGDTTWPSKYPVPNSEIARRVQLSCMSHESEGYFAENFDLDSSYVLKGSRHRGRRTRLATGKSFGDVFMTFRIINDKIPTPEELGIPSEIIEWASYSRGLFLLNGATGTGKTTTLASILNMIKNERPKNITTIENPIEYIFKNDGKGFIKQREIGPDCKSYSRGLDSAMRQAPDIILVGEVRNREEFDALLYAADSGHLAISTMHTNSAPETLDRIMGLYSNSDDQSRVLKNLANITRGFANQILVKRADGRGRIAVREILDFASHPELRSLVEKGDVSGLLQYQRDKHITIEDNLLKEVIAKNITYDDALEQSVQRDYFKNLYEEYQDTLPRQRGIPPKRF